MTTPRLPLAAALLTVCLWSAAFVGIRAAGRAFSPGALALGRLALGSLLLGALLLSRGWTRPSRRDLGLLLLAGVTWFGLYSVVLNEAERTVDAGTASMLIMVAPIIVVALAAVFLKERFTRVFLVGGGVAFAGVLVIGFATSSASATLSGAVLCLLAAVSSAIGLVAQKPTLARLPALQVTWICCTVGALFCLPYALARGSAGRVVAITYLIPPVTIVMSWSLLGEVPSAIALLGGALCLVGVYITRWTPRPTPS